VEVTSNGTTILSEPFEIVFQEPEIAVIEFENTPCFGTLLGSVSSVSNATGPVESILFNNEETSLPIEYLGEGTYQYSLTGSNGCIIDGNIVITQPTEIMVELFFNIAEFPEDCESSISGFSNISGGTPPYTIEWRFFLENEIIPFQVINQDSFNCVDFSEATLVQFRLLDSNGCPLVVEEMLIPSSDQKINSKSPFILNPNPFENTFEITLKESAILSIFDISGKCIYKQDLPAGNTLIQPQNIAPGIYILNINNPSINSNTRIVRR
jgi:hypothetical protein